MAEAVSSSILIVEDQPHVVRVMRLALESAGFNVNTAGNGIEALDFLAQNTPDVMVTDIDMPRMKGDELCRTLHEKMPDRSFPIFVSTARPEREHREWSDAIPNIRFLEKPLSVKRLLSELQDVLGL